MYIGNDLQIAHPSYKIIDDISSGFNGSTTSFALQVSGATPVPFPISTQQVMISVNGVVQEPDPSGSAGFKLLGSNIVFSSAPANGHAFFGVINAGADYVTAGSEFPDGSATSPSFTFQDDQDTGWYRNGSGDVGYSANGVSILNFDGNGVTIAAGKKLITPTAAISSAVYAGGGAGPELYVKGTSGRAVKIHNPNSGTSSIQLTNATTGEGEDTGFQLAQLSGGDMYFDHHLAAKDIVFRTRPSGGSVTERIRLDSSGRLLVGVAASRAVNQAQGSFQIEGTGAEDSDMSIIRNQASAGGPAICFGKSRNASLGGNTVVNDDDQLGALIFNGNDGTDLASQGARIDAYVDGTPGSNDMPGRLTFSTTADGAATTTERMAILSSGDVVIGATASDSFKFKVTNGSGTLARFTDGSSQTLDIRQASGGIELQNPNDGFITFKGASAERFRIGGSGQLGIGGATYGTSGQVLTSGGSSSAPSWTTISAAPEITGTVTGTLPNGTPVVIHTDGTIKKAGNEDPAFGTHTNFDSNLSKMACTQLSGDRMCVVFINDGGTLEAVIGTISGTAVTFGTPDECGYGANGYAGAVACVFTTAHSGRVIVAWYNTSSDYIKLTSISVGSSGTTMTWLAESDIADVYNSEGSPDCVDVNLCASNKIAILYSKGVSTYDLYLRQTIINSSGSFQSWGSQHQITNYVKHARFGNRRGVDSYGLILLVRGGQNELHACSYKANGSGWSTTLDNYFAASIGTNAALPYKQYKPNYIVVTKNPVHDGVGSVNIFGYAYSQEPSSGTYKVRGGLFAVNTTSGAITKISEADIETARRMYLGMAFDNKDDQTTSGVDLNFFNSDYSSPYHGYKTRADLTVNGTSSSLSTWDTPSTLVSGQCLNTDLTYTTGNTFGGKIIFTYRGGASTSSGTAVIRNPIVSNLTAENFVGYSNGSFTNGQTGTVKVAGNVVTGLSGLTPAQKYYLQSDGTLGLSAGSPSVVAGTALTSSSLLINPGR